MNKKSLFISGIIVSIMMVFGVNYTKGALPPPFANFKIDFSQLNLPEGDWQLSFVSISDLGKDTNQAKENFNITKSTYLDVKNLCGVPDYLELKLNPSQEEVESYVGKKVIVQHYFEGDLYYVLNTEKYSICQIPIGYGSYNSDFSTIVKDKYKAITNFWIYNYGKNLFYPNYCEIKDGLCNLSVSKTTQGTYFLVLEKMNSKNEIYFSDPVNINWNNSGKVEWKSFESGSYPLKINQFEFSNPNSLIVSFEGSKSVSNTPFESGSSLPVYYWVIGLIIIIALVILFFSLKRKSKQ